jgi:hypothetical protein
LFLEARFCSVSCCSLFPEQSVAKKTAVELLVGQKPIIEQCYKPEFLRLVPPIHSCEDEVQSSLSCFAHLFSGLLPVPYRLSFQMNKLHCSLPDHFPDNPGDSLFDT